MPELTLYEALAGLFTSAFVSATLFPGASEAVLLALVHAWPDEITAAVTVATIGNTLGRLGSSFRMASSSGGCLAIGGWLASYFLVEKPFIYFYRQGFSLRCLSLWICSTFLTKWHRNRRPDAI